MEGDRDNQIVCLWMKIHWILCSHLWTFYSILCNRNRSSNLNHNLQSSLLKQSRPLDPAFGMPHCCSNPNRSCDRLCQDCLWVGIHIWSDTDCSVWSVQKKIPFFLHPSLIRLGSLIQTLQGQRPVSAISPVSSYTQTYKYDFAHVPVHLLAQL